MTTFLIPYLLGMATMYMLLELFCIIDDILEIHKEKMENENKSKEGHSYYIKHSAYSDSWDVLYGGNNDEKKPVNFTVGADEYDGLYGACDW